MSLPLWIGASHPATLLVPAPRPRFIGRLAVHGVLPLPLVLLVCAVAIVLGLYVLPHAPAVCGAWIAGPQATPDMRVMQEQVRAACASGEARP